MATQVNSQTQLTTEQHIAAARAAWAEQLAQVNAHLAQQRQAEQAADDIAWTQWLDTVAQHVPAWWLPYVQRRNSENDVTEFFLPGCCPITFDKFNHGSILCVLRPKSLEWDDLGNAWYIETNGQPAMDPNHAVDMAACHGAAWAAMRAEADRRNAAGEVPQLEPPQPDPIDQAVTLLGKFSRGEQVTEFGSAAIERSAAVVLAAVGIAIAHHLSRLADAMEARCD